MSDQLAMFRFLLKANAEWPTIVCEYSVKSQKRKIIACNKNDASKIPLSELSYLSYPITEHNLLC